jgi:hypothetical protein
MKTSEHMTGVHVKYWLAYCISTGVQMIYTHSLTRARDSVYSHVTQIHSRDRGKPGKYAGWQDRQLVAVDIKDSVERREERVRNTSVAKGLRECVSASARVPVCAGAFLVKQ